MPQPTPTTTPALAQIHLMLVSEQAAPNLLPALDPTMKPKEAVLLVSQKMVQRAKALQAVLQEVGIKTETVPLPDEHDMAAPALLTQPCSPTSRRDKNGGCGRTR